MAGIALKRPCFLNGPARGVIKRNVFMKNRLCIQNFEKTWSILLAQGFSVSKHGIN